jgi:hypothetical protein
MGFLHICFLHGACRAEAAVSGPGSGQLDEPRRAPLLVQGRLSHHYAAGGARSHCRFVPALIHSIPDPLTYSRPFFLKRQCDRTLSAGPAADRRCEGHQRALEPPAHRESNDGVFSATIQPPYSLLKMTRFGRSPPASASRASSSAPASAPSTTGARRCASYGREQSGYHTKSLVCARPLHGTFGPTSNFWVNWRTCTLYEVYCPVS